MLGTVDMDRHYHPYGIMITKTETAQDYEYMCKAIKDLAVRTGAVNFDPTVLLADAASEITNGYSSS